MVLAGGIASPTGIDLGVERDPDISDLIERLQSLYPAAARACQSMLAEGLLNKQIAYELDISEAPSRRTSPPFFRSLARQPHAGGDPVSRIGTDPVQAAS